MFTPKQQSLWRKLVGTALLWAGLASLIHVSTGGESAYGIVVAVVGFIAFAGGLAFFSDGVKRDILEEIRGK
jgi:hypothetical protein